MRRSQFDAVAESGSCYFLVGSMLLPFLERVSLLSISPCWNMGFHILMAKRTLNQLESESGPRSKMVNFRLARSHSHSSLSSHHRHIHCSTRSLRRLRDERINSIIDCQQPNWGGIRNAGSVNKLVQKLGRDLASRGNE